MMRAFGWTLALVSLLAVVKLSLDGVVRAKQEPRSDLRRYDRPTDAEKAALAELSSLLRAHPRAHRYTVTYSYSGRTFGGVADKSLTFNPERHTLFDLYRSSGDTRLLLSGVTAAEIHAAARRGATMDNLRVAQKRTGDAPEPSR